MYPTYQDGDILLINRLAYLFSKPRVGDVIAAKDPRDKKILIKRIEKVNANKYFVVGDNKRHSTDSREFGMIERKDIIGKVMYP